MGANGRRCVAVAILLRKKGHRVLSGERIEKNLNQLYKAAQLKSWLSSPLLTIVHTRTAASDRVANETIYIP